MTIEDLLETLDSDNIRFLSQEDNMLILEIEGHKVVIIAEEGTFAQPVLSVKVF